MRRLFSRERLASPSGAFCPRISYLRPFFHFLTGIRIYYFKVPLPIFMLLSMLYMAIKVLLATAASSHCLLSFLALVAQPVGN
jgi:hypothetical protein